LRYWILDKTEPNLERIRRLGRSCALFQIDRFQPIFAVGDVISFECLVNGISCERYVFDGRSARTPTGIFRSLVNSQRVSITHLRNPSGILDHANEILLVNSGRFVQIEGEEDLMVLQLAQVFDRGIILFGSMGGELRAVDLQTDRFELAQLLELCGTRTDVLV